MSPLIFLVYVKDMFDPKHRLNSTSQFADDAGLWDKSKKAALATHRLQEELDVLAKWCEKKRIKLNPEKTKLIIFSGSQKETSAKPAIRCPTFNLSSCKILKYNFRQQVYFQKNTLRIF